MQFKITKSKILFITFLLILSYLFTFSATDNSFLPNGDLEFVIEGNLTFWESLKTGIILISDSAKSHSGNHFLEMDFSKSKVLRLAHKSFPISPGQTYIFEGYYLLPEYLSQENIRFFWRWLNSYSGDSTNVVWYEFLPIKIGAEKTSEWQKFSHSITAPENAIAADFIISGEEAPSECKVYFDDFSLTPKDIKTMPTLYIIDRRHIWGVGEQRLSDARMDLLNSLAGLLYQANIGEYIYIYDDLNLSHYNWALRLASNFNAKLDYRFDKSSPDLMWDLINYFKDKIKTQNYILYDYDTTNSVRWAASLAGLEHCLIMDKSIANEGEQKASLTLKLDLTKNYDEDKVWEIFSNHPDANHKLLLENFTDYGKDYRHYLNDLAVAQKAWIFWDPKPSSERRARYLDWADDNSFYFGCGAGDEGVRTAQTSIYGLTCVPADWCWNMGTLPAFKDKIEPWRLRAKPLDIQNLKWEDGVIYVTFILTDGDNLQVLQGDWFFNPKFWGNTHRGEFPIGWQLAPTATWYAPVILESIYADNSPWKATPNDGFVCGNSGMGYHYVGVRDDRAFGTATAKGKSLIEDSGQTLNKWMKNSAVNIVTVMPWDRKDWLASNFDSYAGQIERLLGFLVNTYSGSYKDAHGEIKWTKDSEGNEVPVKALDESLWEKNSTANDIIQILNEHPVSKIPDENSFIYIGVHAWSWKNPVDEVAKCVSAFSSHIRVVRPDEFLMQLRLRLHPEQELNNYTKNISATIDDLNQFQSSSEKAKKILQQAKSQLSLAEKFLSQKEFQKTFETLKEADYQTEIARLNSIQIKQDHNILKLITPKARKPLYYFDSTELWKNAPESIVYHIQISSTPDFSKTILFEDTNLKNNQLQIQRLPAYTRVRAFSTIYNVWGDWSNIYPIPKS